MKVLANIHVNVHIFTSFGAKVDFSRRPRKYPKLIIVYSHYFPLKLSTMLKLLGAVAICDFG